MSVLNYKEEVKVGDKVALWRPAIIFNECYIAEVIAVYKNDIIEVKYTNIFGFTTKKLVNKISVTYTGVL